MGGDAVMPRYYIVGEWLDRGKASFKTEGMSEGTAVGIYNSMLISATSAKLRHMKIVDDDGTTLKEWETWRNE